MTKLTSFPYNQVFSAPLPDMDMFNPVFLFVVVEFASNGILFAVDGVLKGIAPVAFCFNRFHNAITI